ncbi:MAG TPA: LPS export ABC transporter periplasmic protein LptC [Lysobacter sp.]|nr:LPS export ABC transporter periplasmic protein LptC [Lysobacter sp.]
MRLLRIGVPVGALVVVAGFALSAWVSQLKMLIRLPGDLPGLVIQGSKITMQAPRISGYTTDGRPYQLSAHAAAQDLANPNKVELQDLRAKVEMQDKATIDMVAALGVYETKSEMLVLRESIVLTASTGYEARLSEAVIDIRKGTIVSDKPVAVKMLEGTMNANRLEVLEAGDLVRFDGGVSMTLMLNNPIASDARTDVR